MKGAPGSEHQRKQLGFVEKGRSGRCSLGKGWEWAQPLMGNGRQGMDVAPEKLREHKIQVLRVSETEGREQGG